MPNMNLKQKRIAAGLTTTELSRLANVSRKTIWNAENGKNVKEITINKIKAKL
jgi:DNA-binding XRE family transcriptional regulator